MEVWTIWLIAASVLIIIEVMTQTMWSLCLTSGCLAAMVCALCGADIAWQVCSFGIFSITAYILLLPVFRRWHSRTRESRTGMDALPGRKATVTEDIRPGHLGRVRIDGDSWQARAASEETITAGAEVTVIAYDSIILTVTNS